MKESVICFKFLLIVLLSLLPTAKVKAAPSGEPLISLEVANASLQKLWKSRPELLSLMNLPC